MESKKDCQVYDPKFFIIDCPEEGKSLKFPMDYLKQCKYIQGSIIEYMINNTHFKKEYYIFLNYKYEVIRLLIDYIRSGEIETRSKIKTLNVNIVFDMFNYLNMGNGHFNQVCLQISYQKRYDTVIDISPETPLVPEFVLDLDWEFMRHIEDIEKSKKVIQFRKFSDADLVLIIGKSARVLNLIDPPDDKYQKDVTIREYEEKLRTLFEESYGVKMETITIPDFVSELEWDFIGLLRFLNSNHETIFFQFYPFIINIGEVSIDLQIREDVIEKDRNYYLQKIKAFIKDTFGREVELLN